MSKTIEDRAKEYADKYCNGESVIISRLMKDAIEGSYIKGATDQRAIDEKELQPKWISIEEMLPEENGEYLVCTEHDIRTICYYSANLKLFVGTMLHNMRVTHWMPLPPPPSGDKL